MAALTAYERAVLDVLRLRGARERGGLGLLAIMKRLADMTWDVPPPTPIAVMDAMHMLLRRELITYALVDWARDAPVRQSRLYYLTKKAMAA